MTESLIKCEIRLGLRKVRIVCFDRLCSLNITRLMLCKPLGPDVTTIVIAVKMQSSKRTLRSNEISVPNVIDSNTGAVELDLTFSLQYPHFLKRSGNQLQIMIQRRKRYKHRAILGFKTLAFGIINMAEVLQKCSNVEKELEIIANIKELGKNEVVAKILISSLKSLPVDQESSSNGRDIKVPLDRNQVDCEEEDFSSEGSDSETVEEPTAGTHSTSLSTRDRLNQWRRQVNTRNARKFFSNRDNTGSDPNAQQRSDRNFKQKFIALLKKFRLPDSEAFDTEEQYQAALEQQLMASGELQSSRELDDLFEEEDIDDLSDSGQDFDGVSISSTPKPSLRPYFSSENISF